MQLTPRQRLKLIDHLNTLVQPDFGKLVFALSAPQSVIPSESAAQGSRSNALMAWVEGPTGCGMAPFLSLLGDIAPLPELLLDKGSSNVDASKIVPNVAPSRPPSVSTGLDAVQIFLAHAKEDEAKVMELYERLKAKEYRPWLDKKDLIGGQNWRAEILKAIKASQLFIACLSQTSVKKQGYVREEFRLALRDLANKPSGQIYLIPLRLDKCDLPDLPLEDHKVNLRDFHWLDYFEADGFERLEQAIRFQMGKLSASQGPGISPIANTSSSGTAPSQSVQDKTDETKAKTITINQQVVQEPSLAVVEQPQVPPEQTFPFEVVRVNAQGDIVDRQTSQALGRIEDLGNGVTLDLVKIPGGTFLMGSPSDELERLDGEGPQHQVTVPSFWMGRYPITQAQWRAIASFPQVNRTLTPEPSYFKGENHPVEKVSWEEAVEFCDRLSAHTNRPYRLPSEAEWEYACRAGTTTPFHFGETISTELANYAGSKFLGIFAMGKYGKGPLGDYLEQTTPVGSFEIANRFGLFDMHGNVWEWCLDHWHKNYQGSPSDGSAWLENTLQSNNRRVIRGGSWINPPRYCRSASRCINDPDDRDYGLGFRVILAPRYLPLPSSFLPFAFFK